MPDDSNSKVSFGEKFSFGLGDAATSIALTTVTSFLMYYYTDVVGIGAAILGTIFFIARFFDVITDLIMGFLIDKTKSRHGKARPWLLWMMIPYGLSLVSLFIITDSWNTMTALIFIAIAYNIHFLIYTAINIPYGALGSLISQDQMVRTDLNAYRMIFYFALSLIITNFTIPFVNWFGGDSNAWLITMSIYAIILVVMFTIAFKNTKERVKPSVEPDNQQGMSLKAGLKTLLKNKYWLLLIPILSFSWLLLNFIQGSFVYYAEYMLGNDALVGPLTLLFLLPLLVGFILSPSLTRTFGRKKIIIIGLILVIIGSLFMLFSPTSFFIISIGSVIRGFGFAPIMGNAYAMIADTIDYGEWKDGIRIEGLLYSGGTFSTKIGTSIATGGIGWILGLFGYVSGSSIQSGSVNIAMELIFIYIPAFSALVIIISLLFYTLDRIYPKIISDLNRAKGNRDFNTKTTNN